MSARPAPPTTTTTLPCGNTPPAIPCFVINGPATVGPAQPVGADVADVCLPNNQWSQSMLPCDFANPIPLTMACQEDEACWDCTTMGNLICGPVAATVAGVLPATGSTSAPLVGGASVTLALGVMLVFASLRKRVQSRR